MNPIGKKKRQFDSKQKKISAFYRFFPARKMGKNSKCGHLWWDIKPAFSFSSLFFSFPFPFFFLFKKKNLFYLKKKRAEQYCTKRVNNTFFWFFSFCFFFLFYFFVFISYIMATMDMSSTMTESGNPANTIYVGNLDQRLDNK